MPGSSCRVRKAARPLRGIVGPAQHRQQILDVGGLEELEAAVLHEGDLAAPELDLENVAVAGGPEQHRLPAQRHVGLAAPQHLAADTLRLRLQVLDGHEPGPRSFAAARQQVLAVLARRLGHHGVGDVEHLLGGAVVLRQSDHLGPRL